jgi:hypothetical protein
MTLLLRLDKGVGMYLSGSALVWGCGLDLKHHKIMNNEINK